MDTKVEQMIMEVHITVRILLVWVDRARNRLNAGITHRNESLCLEEQLYKHESLDCDGD